MPPRTKKNISTKKKEEKTKGVKKERCRNKYLIYTEKDLMNALEAVKKGMPMRAASQQFKVPFSTIRAKHKGIYTIGKKSGPATILTNEEEHMLVDWIHIIGNKGFPLTKDMLLDSVKLLLKKINRENPFTNGRPGRHWFEAFLNRHPQISLRLPQNLCERRGQVCEEKIRGWFQEVKVHLKSRNLVDIDPSRVFNCDESAFFLSPKGNKVLTNKKCKGVYNVVGANEKECLTTLITGNAGGQLLPPMIMYSYQRLPSTIINKVPRGWSIGRSDNGWMTGESFYEYMTNVFHPWCIANEITFPIVMYLDGHSSYATMALSNFCVEHEIELISLHPNSTHITQPMDVALFHPLKEAWKKAVTDWRMENGGIAVAKQDFAPILQTALQSLNLRDILSHGFTACGLAPLSADAIDYAKLLNHNLVLQQKNINTNSSTAQHNNYECTLTFIESYTDIKILQLFKAAEAGEGEWCGEEKYEALFSIWLKCRKLMSDKNIGTTNSKSIEVSSVPAVKDFYFNV